MFEVDGVAVLLAESDGLTIVQAQPARMVGVELLQAALRQGPGHACLARRAAVVVEDIAAARLWPEMTDGCSWAGMRSVLAVPLLARSRVWGVLELYRCLVQPWHAQELAAARLLAEAAASYVMLAADRDRTAIAQLDAEHRASHDELTGLPGRALLDDRLDHARLTAARHGTAVAVLAVTVEPIGARGATDVTDRAGWDLALVQAARRMASALRGNDTLGRLSGNEFLIICEDLSQPAAAIDLWLRAFGHRLRSHLHARPGPGRAEGAVAVRIGAAVSADRDAIRQLIGDAERAMQAAGVGGRDSFVISRPEVVSLTGYRSRRRR
jgi:diguanylate cyclase (GGDEF)-like protein